ncbi:uncharacterized protein MYCFIDRAFT_174004 [Pseudocercospora fijiensis CIRAD86]|uniref:F-box domain-containing protein n=1 Tax=Pseudocercospora fijiensis (strain CIRAD86) TaxID=383855 RepID=M3B752_PSEFD|nr:uncharacterized protein MYCFIDRAFT_174004 [Pseudocercospora fijiensis CIRAD86]EME85158.1 hypothetical protein MYCFIDRAFT_174004 [Pseudocercospora fijiensis CIRAD86]
MFRIHTGWSSMSTKSLISRIFGGGTLYQPIYSTERYSGQSLIVRTLSNISTCGPEHESWQGGSRDGSWGMPPQHRGKICHSEDPYPGSEHYARLTAFGTISGDFKFLFPGLGNLTCSRTQEQSSQFCLLESQETLVTTHTAQLLAHSTQFTIHTAQHDVYLVRRTNGNLRRARPALAPSFPTSPSILPPSSNTIQSTMHPNPNPNPNLLSLPLELREQIYTHAFTCTDPHAYCIWHGLLLTLVDGKIYKPFTHRPHNLGKNLKKCGSSALPLLRTSKKLHSEASKIFHENLEVRIHIDGRYRSPTEIKGLELGRVEDVGFLRGVRIWDVTVRLENFEDVERLVEQINSIQAIILVESGRRGRVVEWRKISVQISRYADEEDAGGGRRVIEAVKGLTGVQALEEIRDHGAEGGEVSLLSFCWTWMYAGDYIIRDRDMMFLLSMWEDEITTRRHLSISNYSSVNGLENTSHAFALRQAENMSQISKHSLKLPLSTMTASWSHTGAQIPIPACCRTPSAIKSFLTMISISTAYTLLQRTHLAFGSVGIAASNDHIFLHLSWCSR